MVTSLVNKITQSWIFLALTGVAIATGAVELARNEAVTLPTVALIIFSVSYLVERVMQKTAQPRETSI